MGRKKITNIENVSNSYNFGSRKFMNYEYTLYVFQLPQNIKKEVKVIATDRCRAVNNLKDILSNNFHVM